MNAENTSSSAKLVVDSTKVNLLDTKLAKKRGAHDARLDRNVKGALGNNRSVNARSRVKLLAVGEEVAVAGVNVAPNARLIVVALGLRVLRLKISITRVRQQSTNSHELSMSSAVAADVGCVHAPGDYSILVHKYAADRRLVGLEGESGLQLKPVSNR